MRRDCQYHAPLTTIFTHERVDDPRPHSVPFAELRRERAPSRVAPPASASARRPALRRLPEGSPESREGDSGLPSVHLVQRHDGLQHAAVGALGVAQGRVDDALGAVGAVLDGVDLVPDSCFEWQACRSRPMSLGLQVPKPAPAQKSTTSSWSATLRPIGMLRRVSSRRSWGSPPARSLMSSSGRGM